MVLVQNHKRYSPRSAESDLLQDLLTIPLTIPLKELIRERES